MTGGLPCAFVLAVMAAGAMADSAPDYDLADSWLARPGIESPALLVPGGDRIADDASLPADAFYIHPTTGMNTDIDNVPVDDESALATARLMLMTQATPFNGVARIFAPRYRQAALPVFGRDLAEVQAPMNLAYQDVRRAFVHYVRHDNRGRPFFIVAHSQGSNHALRLLADEVAGSPLQNLLVGAYLPGMPVPLAVFDGDLATVPPCATPTQTGCVAAWGTFADGYTDFDDWKAVNHFWDSAQGRWRTALGMELVNVNPVSWRMGGVMAPVEAHLGAVPFGVRGSHFARIVPRLVGVRVAADFALVTPVPDLADLFDDGGIFEAGNYHVFDIALFWADIRANAATRLDAWERRDAAPDG
ncbi:MAG: DUF3089 domain-containing protein [Rubellimicrobium sp.]|nr:DUF3089 domain-containing protein [Rubellimicrobium sp.]